VNTFIICLGFIIGVTVQIIAIMIRRVKWNLVTQDCCLVNNLLTGLANSIYN
jgi:hypothetical protein